MTTATTKLMNIPRSLAYGYDPEDIVPVIKKLFKHGRLEAIVDIGSGNGIHAIEFAKEFPLAEVFATEPDLHFFESLRTNAAEAKKLNLRLFNLSIEEFSKKFEQRVFDLVHCSMVLPFVEDLNKSLLMISEMISPNGLAVVSLFTYPNAYSANEISASKEYMSKALTKVVNFPSQSEFEFAVSENHLSIVSQISPPLPQRYRDDELFRFKEAALARRKIIDDETRVKFNLVNQNGLSLSPVSTFIFKKL
jgi:16S rRNA G527 N7-methylase RsmG